jgi:hypothetical protein
VRKKPWDILQQHESRSYDANDCRRCRPHVSVVVRSSLPPGNAERLAWESCADDINHTRIACGVPVTDECADIGEDGRGVETAVFDPLRDDFLAVVVPFDVTDGCPSE